MPYATLLFSLYLHGAAIAGSGSPPAQSAAQKPCDFAPDPTLRIACTVQWGPDCGDNYRKAVQEAADRMKVKVQFVSLMGGNVDLATGVDAILSPGGDDILPEYFLTQAPDTPEKVSLRGKMRKEYYDLGLGVTTPAGKLRDSFEFQLATRYLVDPKLKNLPFLATCYGMQMMGAAVGLPLYVDLPTDIGVPAQRSIEPAINVVVPGSLIGKVIGSGGFTGAKNHHQALDYEYYLAHKAEFPNLQITASSVDNKIAETLELRGRPFLGIQFHAERSAETTRRAVYDWLIHQACQGAKQRAGGAAASRR